jgi:hypothetical protein
MKPQKPYKKTLSITIVLSLAILGFFIFRQDILDILAQLNLQSLKDNYASLKIYFNDRPFQSSLVYVAIYILVTALSLPWSSDFDACWRSHLWFVVGHYFGILFLYVRSHRSFSSNAIFFPELYKVAFWR